MRVLPVALVATLALAPSVAAAQEIPDLTRMTPIEETEQELQKHLVWQPSLALTTLGYDSNVYNRPPSETAPTGDWVAGATGSLAPVWRVGRVRLSGLGIIVGNYFHRFAQERGIDATTGGRLDVPIARVRLHAFGEYLNVRQRLNFEVDERARRTEGHVGTGLDVTLGARTTLGVQVRQSTLDFQEDRTSDQLTTLPIDGVVQPLHLRQTMNRTDRLAAAFFQYEITPLTDFVVTAEAGRHRFDLSPLRDGDSGSVRAGLTFGHDALIEGQWSVGWRRVTVRDPLVPPYSGPVVDVNLSSTIGVSTRLGVRARRDAVFSAEDESPYYAQSSVGGSITQALGERWDVTFRGERVWLNYVTPLNALFSGSEHHEYVDVLGGGFGIRLPGGWRMSVQVDRQRRRSSSEPTRTYDTTRMYTVFSPNLRF